MWRVLYILTFIYKRQTNNECEEGYINKCPCEECSIYSHSYKRVKQTIAWDIYNNNCLWEDALHSYKRAKQTMSVRDILLTKQYPLLNIPCKAKGKTRYISIENHLQLSTFLQSLVWKHSQFAYTPPKETRPMGVHWRGQTPPYHWLAEKAPIIDIV